jgi:hypothetical protein
LNQGADNHTIINQDAYPYRDWGANNKFIIARGFHPNSVKANSGIRPPYRTFLKECGKHQLPAYAANTGIPNKMTEQQMLDLMRESLRARQVVKR